MNWNWTWTEIICLELNNNSNWNYFKNWNITAGHWTNFDRCCELYRNDEPKTRVYDSIYRNNSRPTYSDIGENVPGQDWLNENVLDKMATFKNLLNNFSNNLEQIISCTSNFNVKMSHIFSGNSVRVVLRKFVWEFISWDILFWEHFYPEPFFWNTLFNKIHSLIVRSRLQLGYWARRRAARPTNWPECSLKTENNSCSGDYSNTCQEWRRGWIECRSVIREGDKGRLGGTSWNRWCAKSPPHPLLQQPPPSQKNTYVRHGCAAVRREVCIIMPTLIRDRTCSCILWRLIISKYWRNNWGQSNVQINKGANTWIKYVMN